MCVCDLLQLNIIADKQRNSIHLNTVAFAKNYALQNQIIEIELSAAFHRNSGDSASQFRCALLCYSTTITSGRIIYSLRLLLVNGIRSSFNLTNLN